MTDSTYALGAQYAQPAQVRDTPSAPPIPPPLGDGQAQVSPQAEPAATAPRRAPGHLRRNLLATGALAAIALLALLLAGAFKAGTAVTAINAPASAQARAQAQAGLKEPGSISVTGQAPFVLHYPTGWTRLTTAQLARIANVPAAGLVAEGGRAVLLVRPKRPLTQSLSVLSTELTRSLSSHFADFKLLSTGTIRTLAGPAWVYTFERSKHGLVQSEVVVSTNRAAYEIDIALRGGANRAAGQIGLIVHSFQS